MDSKKKFHEVTDKLERMIKQESGISDYIINYFQEESALTRFACNHFTQNLQRDQEMVYITLYVEGKKASLCSNVLSDEGLNTLLQKTLSVAKSSVVDLEYVPSYDSSANDDFQREAMEGRVEDHLDPKARTKVAAYAITTSKLRTVIASGTVENVSSAFGVSTKFGARRFYQDAFAEYSNTIDIGGEKGSARKSASKISEIDYVQVFEDAHKDATLLQNKREFSPGRYKVLLGRKASSDLFSNMLYYGVDRRSFDEGHSPFTDKLGQVVADKRITIFTDPKFASLHSRPFTKQGRPIIKQQLIDKGVLTNLPTSPFWAKKHALCEWSMGNLILEAEGASKSEEELLKELDRGFYLKDLWYIRLVRKNDMTLTGMTRNGIFYVEDGKIVCGANHFRWNDSPLSMLSRVLECSKSVACRSKLEGIDTAIPAMLISDFYLCSKTGF
ncbi:MAG: hypothetical protein HQK50_15180 [Oligoflexia bacterium]|nr:hypothetical protein [Oligoflexia bacterium]MBF0366916.1 hypothetical protein [Oligoflexia bacterium]